MGSKDLGSKKKGVSPGHLLRLLSGPLNLRITVCIFCTHKTGLSSIAGRPLYAFPVGARQGIWVERSLSFQMIQNRMIQFMKSFQIQCLFTMKRLGLRTKEFGADSRIFSRLGGGKRCQSSSREYLYNWSAARGRSGKLPENGPNPKAHGDLEKRVRNTFIIGVWFSRI